MLQPRNWEKIYLDGCYFYEYVHFSLSFQDLSSRGEFELWRDVSVFSFNATTSHSSFSIFLWHPNFKQWERSICLYEEWHNKGSTFGCLFGSNNLLVSSKNDVHSVNDDDLPTALYKGKRSYTNHPISNFVTYKTLNPLYCTFVGSVSSVQVPSNLKEAIS